MFAARLASDKVEDHATRDLSVLESVEDLIDRRQRLQLDVGLDLAFGGEGQGLGHILAIADERAANGDAVRDHIK